MKRLFMQITYRDQPTFRRLVDVHAQWLDPAFIRHIRGGTIVPSA